MRVAKGANFTCVLRIICGENGADRGSGLGPCTVQVSLRPDVERDAKPGAVVFEILGAASSKYADPDAEGVTPVLRTTQD